MFKMFSFGRRHNGKRIYGILLPGLSTAEGHHQLLCSNDVVLSTAGCSKITAI